MGNKNVKQISTVALIISILPIFTLIPVFLDMSLPEGLRHTWAGFNMVCVFLGFVLSIIGIRRNKEKGYMKKVAMWISSFWMLMVTGVLLIALISNLPVVGV